MKALVCHKNGRIELVEKEIPKIQDRRDAVIKVTMASICTSDLHIMHGAVPRAVPDTVLGHEYVGEVVELGDDVKNLKIGDRVSVNCITFCEECYFCKRGFINNCINGGWELGCRIDGGHAEYSRIPFADCSLSKIPDNVSDKSALFVGDILASGYWGAELCEIKQGDTIAVMGSGPVGMCAMECAKVLGAGKVIAIDFNENRLDVARRNKLADYFFNPEKCDVEKEIKLLTKNRGADGVIEAAGGENTLEMSWKIARPNAIVAVVAMYEKPQTIPLPDMYGKNLIFKTGGVDAVHCDKILELIAAGKISTDFLVTHTFSLDNIVEAYRLFENKEDNCIKVAIVPEN